VTTTSKEHNWNYIYRFVAGVSSLDIGILTYHIDDLARQVAALSGRPVHPYYGQYGTQCSPRSAERSKDLDTGTTVVLKSVQIHRVLYIVAWKRQSVLAYRNSNSAFRVRRISTRLNSWSTQSPNCLLPVTSLRTPDVDWVVAANVTFVHTCYISLWVGLTTGVFTASRT
jgi:hypothetical protein